MSFIFNWCFGADNKIQEESDWPWGGKQKTLKKLKKMSISELNRIVEEASEYKQRRIDWKRYELAADRILREKQGVRAKQRDQERDDFDERGLLRRYAYPHDHRKSINLYFTTLYLHDFQYYAPCFTFLYDTKDFPITEQCMVCFGYPCVAAPIYTQLQIKDYRCLDLDQRRSLHEKCYLCYPWCGCCCPYMPCGQRNVFYKCFEDPLPLDNFVFVATGLACGTLFQPLLCLASILTYLTKRTKSRNDFEVDSEDATPILLTHCMNMAVTQKIMEQEEITNRLSEVCEKLQTETDDVETQEQLQKMIQVIQESGDYLRVLRVQKSDNILEGTCCLYCQRCSDYLAYKRLTIKAQELEKEGLKEAFARKELWKHVFRKMNHILNEEDEYQEYGDEEVTSKFLLKAPPSILKMRRE